MSQPGRPVPAGLAGGTDYSRWIGVALFGPGALLFMLLHVGSNVVLFPVFGVLLSPMIACAAMTFSSVSFIANALRLRSLRL